jgi:DegV family protein with EDD domain
VPFADLEAQLLEVVSQNKVFFCVETLKYLKAGGRINEITYLMGNLLKVNPIISCNSKGVYYVVKAARGHRAAIEKMIKLAQEKAAELTHFNVAVMHAGAHDKAQEILAKVRSLFPKAQLVFEGQFSPALVVHTGPGTVGIGIQSVA